MAASAARRRARRFAAAGTVALAVAPGAQAAAQPAFTVIASGLDNPRGLAFGPDGALYVAEAGRGGSGSCLPGPGPEGREVCFGVTGAVTRIKGSQQSRVLTGLPSRAERDGSGADGPSDVSFLGLGFVTVGLHADPAVRAQLPPSGRTLGHLLTFAPGVPGALPLADLAGHERSPNLAKLLPSGGTLDFLRAFVPRVPRVLPAVPLADVAGHEVRANPDGGEVDSNPHAVHVGPRGAAVADAGGNSLVRVGFDRRIETLAVPSTSTSGRAPPCMCWRSRTIRCSPTSRRARW